VDTRMTRFLHEGILLFNRGQFFEAHEVWEDAWRRAHGDDQLLLHGLIQVAAGFHKLQVGQPPGAASLLAKGTSKLAALRGETPVRDLASFRASAETWRQAAARMAGQEATEYDVSSLPRLPEPRRGIFERRIHSHIEIEASAQRVWEVLTDFETYPLWNPFIPSLVGAARPGNRLTVEIRPPGRRAMRFNPVVLVADPGRELRWLGHVILPGLFDGEHVFTVAPLATGSVRFSQRETFRGLLVPLMPRSMWDATRRGFDEMNDALKRRVELTTAQARRI
jgi:hypothetical protein